jgi:putative oxidoreductase
VTGPWGWRYIFRLALGLVFIWASLAKIGDLAGFAAEMHNYHILPLALENLFAMTLPWVELVAGVALVVNLAPRAATLLLGGLLAVFLLAILSAIARDLDIACGCFGTADATRTGWIALLRDVGLLVVALLGYPWGRTQRVGVTHPVTAA